MRDPYALLGEELAAAARRLEQQRHTPGRLRAWFARRLNAGAVAAAVLLSGGAVALAATGVLDGSPVKPERPTSPLSGNGLPVSRTATQLVQVAADPAGGLSWGMRVFHTTRGQVCMQVGRVQSDQLGVLGLDSAFDNDGRFHALPTDDLPPGYGGSSANVECVVAGQTLIFEAANADRSAERLLPEEFRPGRAREIPPVWDLRTLAYGILGPHAVSVTYRTPTGLRTVPVAGADGAFLIVEPAGVLKNSSLIGGSFGGQASAASVVVILPVATREPSIVTAATFKFGAKLCSQGHGAPVRNRCPTRPTVAPKRWFQPKRSLRIPIRLTLLPQSHSACNAAFLLYPCYKGQVEFTAPYAVTSAASDYEIESIAKCKIGGRPETAWTLERDVQRHEPIRTVSLGSFVFTPKCAADESFKVTYLNQRGPSAAAPHESVILGSIRLNQATFPGGAPVMSHTSSRPSTRPSPPVRRTKTRVSH
jgi:hypothetical protein